MMVTPKYLPFVAPLFEYIDAAIGENFLVYENIAGGGAAMRAYARMQFPDMTDLECNCVVGWLY
jgi:hypothetical protein